MTHDVARMMADRQKKIQYICSCFPKDETTRIFLTHGGSEGPDIYADLYPLIDDEGNVDLEIDTNEQEAIGLDDVYQYFRLEDMTSEEWQRWWDHQTRQNEGSNRRSEFREMVDSLSVTEREVFEAASETDPVRGELLTIKAGHEYDGHTKGCMAHLVKMGLFKKVKGGYLRAVESDFK